MSSSILQVLNPKRLLNPTHSIGVIGLGMSGKTVFLTSLIDHLCHHDPEFHQSRFNLGDLQISALEFLPSTKSGIWDVFDYNTLRAQMASQKAWPERTSACSSISLKFKFQYLQNRGNWLKPWTWGQNKDRRTWLDYTLTFYDIPGQRTSDVALYENDYQQWSALVLKNLENLAVKKTREEAPNLYRYLDCMKQPGMLPMNELVLLYKRVMLELYDLGCSDITPAVFLLDDSGKTFERRQEEIAKAKLGENWKEAWKKKENEEMVEEEFLKTACSGCPNAEFVPLSPEWMGELALDRIRFVNPLGNEDVSQAHLYAEKTYRAIFAASYEHYKKVYVYPLFGTLISCDTLVFLVDIPTILQHGVDEVNMYQSIVENMLRGLNPGDATLRKLLTLRYSRRVERIAFAASQCDRFHPGDWELLRTMLKKLISPVCNRLPQQFQKEYFYISAVQSVKCKNGKMNFNLKDKNGQAKEVQEDYWRIPEEWNEDWPNDEQSEEFITLCQTKGKRPRRPLAKYSELERTPPEQIHLDSLFKFLIPWCE